MRKIATAAVALALLMAGASTHMASAQATQHSKEKPSPYIAVTTNKPEQSEETAPTPAPSPSPVFVTVQTGDTLSGIAAAHQTTYMRLYDTNTFITNPNLIFPGQRIRIPNTNVTMSSRTTPATPPTPVPRVVTVQTGDTLSGIARANSTTVTRMYDANPSLSNPNLVYAGQQLSIPTAAEQLPNRAPAAVTRVAAVPVAATAPAPTTAPVSAPVTTSVSTAAISAAKAYIYNHESGNNPNATNSLGCYGLGQDCSGTLRPLCGSDYACQDQFFDHYAQVRYGGWLNAEAFWKTHGWW